MPQAFEGGTNRAFCTGCFKPAKHVIEKIIDAVMVAHAVTCQYKNVCVGAGLANELSDTAVNGLINFFDWIAYGLRDLRVIAAVFCVM